MMQPAKKKKLGLFPITIGSNHVFKNADGIRRQFRAGDIRLVEDPEAKLYCFRCKQSYASKVEMLAAHGPDSELQKQEDGHPYGYWSDKPLVKGDKNPAKVVGLLSDILNA